MKRWKKILLWCLAAVLLLPVLAGVSVAVLARVLYPWPEPVPGVRLEPLTRPLAPEQIKPDNGFFYVRQLQDIRESALTKWVEEEDAAFHMLGWQAGRCPQMDRRLAELAPNLNLLEQAAALPGTQQATNAKEMGMFPCLLTGAADRVRGA